MTTDSSDRSCRGRAGIARCGTQTLRIPSPGIREPLSKPQPPNPKTFVSAIEVPKDGPPAPPPAVTPPYPAARKWHKVHTTHAPAYLKDVWGVNASGGLTSNVLPSAFLSHDEQ